MGDANFYLFFHPIFYSGGGGTASGYSEAILLIFQTMTCIYRINLLNFTKSAMNNSFVLAILATENYLNVCFVQDVEEKTRLAFKVRKVCVDQVQS